MNKQQMIDEIYAEVADKTLSFGCKVKAKGFFNKSKKDSYFIFISNGFGKNIKTGKLVELPGCGIIKENKDVYEIIGQPVMIGDIFQRADKHKRVDLRKTKKGYAIDGDNTRLVDLIMYWENLNRPIEEQNIKFIQYVHELIFPKNSQK